MRRVVTYDNPRRIEPMRMFLLDVLILSPDASSGVAVIHLSPQNTIQLPSVEVDLSALNSNCRIESAEQLEGQQRPQRWRQCRDHDMGWYFELKCRQID